MLPPWAVILPMVATGVPLIKTVGSPWTMESGGPVHTHISPIKAAGFPLISTLGAPGPLTGPPTWGTYPVTMGQTCILPMVAIGFPAMINSLLWLLLGFGFKFGFKFWFG